MKQEKRVPIWLRTSVLSWLLLGIWLSYSATLLWKLEAGSGAASVCMTRR